MKCASSAALFLHVALLSCVSRSAIAQDYTHRSLLVPQGSFQITGEPARPQILRFNASDGRLGQPVHLAPHFYWGISDSVTLGITHREGLCLNACADRPYNDAGFALLVNLSRSPDVELNLDTGVEARSFSPFLLGFRAGLLGRVTFGATALVFNPMLYAGLTERGHPNREELVLPFWLYFQASQRVVPFVGTSLVGPWHDFADAYAMPVEAGVLFEVSAAVDLGFYFRFDNLLGDGGNPDARELGLLGRFRF
jgi:hypothetical protein